MSCPKCGSQMDHAGPVGPDAVGYICTNSKCPNNTRMVVYEQ